MIENYREMEEVRAVERQRIETAARVDALRKVTLWKCLKCGKPVFWNLNDPRQRRRLFRSIKNGSYLHIRCPQG